MSYGFAVFVAVVVLLAVFMGFFGYKVGYVEGTECVKSEAVSAIVGCGTWDGSDGDGCLKFRWFTIEEIKQRKGK